MIEGRRLLDHLRGICTPQIGRTMIDFLETVTYRQGRFYRRGQVITGPPRTGNAARYRRDAVAAGRTERSARAVNRRVWTNAPRRVSSTCCPTCCPEPVAFRREASRRPVPAGDQERLPEGARNRERGGSCASVDISDCHLPLNGPNSTCDGEDEWRGGLPWAAITLEPTSVAS